MVLNVHNDNDIKLTLRFIISPPPVQNSFPLIILYRCKYILTTTHLNPQYIDLDFVSNKPSQSPQDQITGKGLLGEELAQKKEMRGAEERSSSEGYHEIDIEKTQALSQIIAHRENQTEYSS